MTTINLGTKIVSSAAATTSFQAESRSGLALEVTLQSSAGVAHNGSNGRVALYLGRAGKNQDLLAWVRGASSGVYSVAAGTALTVPRLSLVCLDSMYSFGLWWEPDSGSPVLLYTGDLQIVASQGGVVDLTPAATQVSGYARIYHGSAVAGLTGTSAIEAALFAADVLTGRVYRYPETPAAQKLYVAHPQSLGSPDWTLDEFAIDEQTRREVTLHNSAGALELYWLRESDRNATGTNLPLELGI